MSALTVVHANELVESSYNLAIDELRVIALASTKVDSRKKNIGDIRIDLSEFVDAYGLERNKRVYSSLRNAVKSIMRKPIRIFDSGRREYDEYAWLTKSTYSVDDGSHVVIRFSPDLAPYLFELKESFTSINFEYASKLNTPFSFRLYQWLYKAKNLNKSKSGDAVRVVLEVDWMKSQAALVGGYERWDVFRDKVIKPAVERINSFTDLSVFYEPVKTGRKVTAVKFTYVVETASVVKPIRPRLKRRPKVKKGSHEEGVWMRQNLAILLDYEARLKAYDSEAKLDIKDVERIVEYSAIFDTETNKRAQDELQSRKCKSRIEKAA